MSSVKNSEQRAALMAAVETGDVDAIRGLLDALPPDAAFKSKLVYEVALNSGEEAVVQPFIEAFRRDPGPDRLKSRIAWWVFEDDRFSASFAGSLVAYVTGGKGGERASFTMPGCSWGTVLRQASALSSMSDVKTLCWPARWPWRSPMAGCRALRGWKGGCHTTNTSIKA
jgi:hypothetical protein